MIQKDIILYTVIVHVLGVAVFTVLFLVEYIYMYHFYFALLNTISILLCCGLLGLNTSLDLYLHIFQKQSVS